MSEVYTKCRLLLEQLDCYVTNQALSKYEIEDDIKKLESFIAEQTQALQRRVEWTANKPTESGWYYRRVEKDLSYYIVWISSNLRMLRVMHGIPEFIPDDGEWARVPAPNEARKF